MSVFIKQTQEWWRTVKLFKDKNAIVTGGVSGIWRELCIRLAESGAMVYVADIKIKGVELIASTITVRVGRA